MRLNASGEPLVYKDPQAAGKAALTWLRRLNYSRYGGHRLPTSSFEYGGTIIGDGDTWTYLTELTRGSRERIVGLGTADDIVFHSHTNDPLAMIIEKVLRIAIYPNPFPIAGNEGYSDLDVAFQMNFMLSPTNQMNALVGATGFTWRIEP